MDPLLTTGDRRAIRALLYLAIAAVAFVVLSFVATIAAYFSDILAIFFLAWLLAFLLDPFAGWLVRAVGWIPRGGAVLVVYLIIALLTIVLVVVIADLLALSIKAFIDAGPRLRQDLPGLLAPYQQQLDGIGLGQFQLAAGATAILDSFNAGSTEVLQPLQRLAVFGVGAFGTLVLIVFLSLYMAADGERLRVSIHRLFPARFETNLAVFEKSVAHSFGGFVRGQVLLGLLYGAVAFATSATFELPYLPLIVVTVTVVHMLPFFGPFVSWAPPVVVAIFFVPTATIPVLLIMGISMLLVMNLVQPRLMGDAVGLHPVVVLGSVLVGAKIAGALGAIFAVPVAAVLAAVIGQWRARAVAAPATAEQMAAAARHAAVITAQPALPGFDDDRRTAAGVDAPYPMARVERAITSLLERLRTGSASTPPGR